MPRGNAHQSKVHYQGKEDDFVIFVDDVKSVQNWKDDRSIPLAHVVSGFKIFVTHKYDGFHFRPSINAFLNQGAAMADVPKRRHGAQNAHDEASKQILENEFGTHNEDECMIKILEGGSLQETESAERQAQKNETMGPRMAH
ncbi:MAG: hypothetical protein Q9178_008088 [Gyalolechia marmorata]